MTRKSHSSTHPIHHEISPRGSLRGCIVGFVFSLALTLIAYFLVVMHPLPSEVTQLAIVMLCVVQLAIQLIYFLHLGDEPKPYWNLLIFGFMVMVLVILVAGSLWILYDLNYRGGM